MAKYSQQMVKGMLQLLSNCPAETAHLRKELLIAAKHILTTDLRSRMYCFFIVYLCIEKISTISVYLGGTFVYLLVWAITYFSLLWEVNFAFSSVLFGCLSVLEVLLFTALCVIEVGSFSPSCHCHYLPLGWSELIVQWPIWILYLERKEKKASWTLLFHLSLLLIALQYPKFHIFCLTFWDRACVVTQSSVFMGSNSSVASKKFCEVEINGTTFSSCSCSRCTHRVALSVL